jgi:chromosomal replication initiator protein
LAQEVSFSRLCLPEGVISGKINDSERASSGHPEEGIERTMQTFASWVSLPENRSARVAVARLAGCLCNRRFRPHLTPLLLHGPSGTGKSHLASALLTRVSQRRPDCLTSLLTARDLLEVDPDSLSTADLIVVEDLQHLPQRTLERASEGVVGLLDRSRARRQYLLLTASGGPAELPGLPGRLTSRLAAGLVVRLDPLGPALNEDLTLSGAVHQLALELG